MDLAIREFEAGLVEYINSAELPIEVKRLVMNSVLSKVNEASEKAIAEQIKNKEKESDDGIHEAGLGE